MVVYSPPVAAVVAEHAAAAVVIYSSPVAAVDIHDGLYVCICDGGGGGGGEYT